MNPKAPKANCSECPLKDQPLVPGMFRGTPDYILVGEAPGRNEARLGVPFIGESGKLLDAMLAVANLDPNRCFITNAVLCRPPRNEFSEEALLCCADRLYHELRAVRKKYPVPVVALGKRANEILVGESKKRGYWQPGPKGIGPVLHLFHPAYTLRRPSTATETLAGLSKVHRYDQLPKKGLGVPDTRHIVLDDIKKVKQWVDAMIANPGYIAWDLETDQLDWKTDRILCLAASWKPGVAIIIPDEMLYHSMGTQAHLTALFEASDITFICHNGIFDVKFMRQQTSIPARVDFDTLLAHYTLDERTGGGEIHSLKTLIRCEFDVPDYEQELVQKYLKSRNDRYSKVPRPSLYQYAAVDADYTLRCAKVFEERLHADGLYERPFMFPLMAAVEPLIAMEMIGVPIDEEKLIAVEQQLIAERDEIHKELIEVVGHDFNARSSAQKSRILYDEWNCQIVTGRRMKARSTNAAARGKLKELYGPDTQPGKFLRLLDHYARVEKLRGSYATNTLPLIDEGRVYPTFKLHGSETGRLSATRPAIQTIPRSSEKYGKMIKTTYAAKPGYVILQVDYSQAELRVAAALSNEQFLIQVYEDNRDLHSEVAVAMYGENFTKPQRILTKMFNFSYLYGGSERSFADDAGLPMAQARAFIQQYNTTMPRLAAWKTEMERLTHEQGYIETPFGRRRRFPLIIRLNQNEVRKASVNMPVQSSASDLTLISLCRVCEWLDMYPKVKQYAKPIITVHDSIVFEVAEKIALDFATIVKGIMEDVGNEWFPQVPWKADVEIGPNWGELKSVTIEAQLSKKAKKA